SVPGVRFYAGAPIRTPDGFRLGALCAMDTSPRRIRPSQQEALRDLAQLVADEIELRLAGLQMADALAKRAAADRMQEGQDRLLHELLETASDWIWETDPQHRLSYLSSMAPAGQDAQEMIGRTRLEIAGADPADPAWRAHLDDLEARRPFRCFRW